MNDAECPGESSEALVSGPEVNRGTSADPLALPRVQRPAGSAAEEQTARRVMQAFHAAATPAITLPANVPTVSGYAELVSIPLLLMGILLGLFQPVLGALALLLGIALYAAETAGEGLLARIFPRRSTTSVLAAIPAQRRELRRVIVVTALDSPSAGLLDRPTFAAAGRYGPHTIVSVGLLAIALFIWQALATSPFSELWLIIPATALVALLMLHAEPSLRRMRADYDDTTAEALGAIVEFGARVRAHPTHWVDVWCFVTGGGSVSGEALRQFIRDNQLAPETSYFINLNLVPHSSTVSVALAEGPLWKRRSSPALVRVLTNASGRPPRPRMSRITQAAVPISMGYQAITVGLPLGAGGSMGADAVDVPQLLLDTLSVIDNELVERNRVARLAQPASRRAGRVARPPHN